MTKIKPHPGLSWRQQSALAKKLGCKFGEVGDALLDWDALDKMGMLEKSRPISDIAKSINEIY